MGKIVGSLGLLALTVGCTPETDPYALAPKCPEDFWCEVRPTTFCDAPPLLPHEGEILALTDLLNIALCNNPDTKITWANARFAAAKYGESRSTYYPEIDAQAYYELDRIPEYYNPGDVQTEDLRTTAYHLTLDWLLYDFGARGAKTCGFREALVNANWTHSREIQTVLQTVIADYYAYLGDKERVAAAKEDLLDAKTNLDATVKRRIAGISNLQDEMQARTEVAQRRLALLRAEQDLVDVMGLLAENLGVPATLDLHIQGMPKEVQLCRICESVEGFLSKAYACRPDLLAAYAGVHSRQAFVKEAWRNQWGQFTLTGDVGRTNYNGTSDQYDYTAQLRLEIPLFKGWAYQNRIKEAQAQLLKARAELRQVKLAISKDVVTGYKDVMLAGKKVEASEDYVVAAKQSYEAILKNYKVGVADFVTLMNALAQLADARASLVTSRQDWYTALANLAYATGTLSRNFGCAG